MLWKSSKHPRPLETIARTAFFTSLASYIVFWLADLSVPGFVSRYFSVHFFLLSSVVFGLLWSHTLEEYEERPYMQACAAVTLGIIDAVLVWFASDGAGGYRMVLVIGAFLGSVLVLKILTDQDS